jgi:hypothetical protein
MSSTLRSGRSSLALTVFEDLLGRQVPHVATFQRYSQVPLADN